MHFVTEEPMKETRHEGGFNAKKDKIQTRQATWHLAHRR